MYFTTEYEQNLTSYVTVSYEGLTDGKAYLSVEVPDSHYVQHAMLRTIFTFS